MATKKLTIRLFVDESAMWNVKQSRFVGTAEFKVLASFVEESLTFHFGSAWIHERGKGMWRITCSPSDLMLARFVNHLQSLSPVDIEATAPKKIIALCKTAVLDIPQTPKQVSIDDAIRIKRREAKRLMEQVETLERARELLK